MNFRNSYGYKKIASFFKILDKKNFLNFPMREFCFRSFWMPYRGKSIKTFLLTNPVKFIPRYRKFLRLLKKWKQNKKEILKQGYFLSTSKEEIKRKVKKNPGKCISSFSYCMKPHNCPMGRFNSECLCFHKTEENSRECDKCPIKKGMRSSIDMGFHTHIVTDGIDVNENLLDYCKKDFEYVSLFLCEYSVLPGILSFCFTNSEFGFFLLDKSCSCNNRVKREKADGGNKDEETFGSKNSNQNFEEIMGIK